jgi:hypothetical protein
MQTNNIMTTTKPFIKSLCTTLACVVTSSALALDDRFEEPPPQEDPKPQGSEIKRPDLVPLGVDLAYDSSYDDWDPVLFEHVFQHRHYLAKVSLINLGNADAVHLEQGKYGPLIDSINCYVGYKVLASTDPVNYPVGYSVYKGLGSFVELKVLETTEVDTFISIPKVVTAAEIFVVVDRPLDPSWYNGGDYTGTWEDDFGADYIGDVVEHDESNNVLGGLKLYFEEYNPTQPITPPVVLNPKLELRKK